MRKYLSIIIPSYKETEQQIFPLLSSINGQVGIDFDDIEVIIVRDGTEILDETFLSLFSLDIKQIPTMVNGGPGMARQVGIDAAKGEYLMFCDADDIIQNVGVVGAMIQLAETNAPDMVSTPWLEEIYDVNTGKYQYIRHDIENTWMHGKLIRRQFLVQNNIRHHPELRIHEDSYFLSICAAAAQKNIHGDFVSYVWKWAPDSITRRNNNNYYFDSVPIFLEACCMSFHEVEERNPEQITYKTIQLVLYQYFTSHRPEWQRPENLKYQEAANAALVKNIAPFWKYWEVAGSEAIAKVYNEERNKNFSGLIETETLNEWLKRIGLIHDPETNQVKSTEG